MIRNRAELSVAVSGVFNSLSFPIPESDPVSLWLSGKAWNMLTAPASNEPKASNVVSYHLNPMAEISLLCWILLP